MKAYRYNKESKKYEGEINCQLDPLESKIQGEEVWLLPAHSTFEAPLEEKEGFDVIWNGSAWEYQAVPEPESEPEPTPEEQKQIQISELKAQLSSTDYKIIKCSECSLAGIKLPYDVVALHAERQALRDAINELENE